MTTEENSWRTQSFRQSVIAKIDEAVQISGMPTARNSIDMENHVFQKAKTKEEYLSYVARLILHVRELNNKKGTGGTAPGTAGTGNQGMPDPIGALQTLAHRGTGNNQIMGMNGPGPNPQGIIPQPSTNTATNYNFDTYKRLIESPSQTEFRQYIDRRKDEELLHESWKLKLREDANLAKKIKEQCGMAVDLGDNRVRYIYKPDIDGILIPGIKFKITIIYVKLLRKWYISLGYSRLPEVIDLQGKMKNGTYNPIGSTVLKIVRKTKYLLEIYVERLLFIYQTIEKMKDAYKDIEFEVTKALTKVKVILKEKAWPKSIKKTSPEDIIVIEVTLNENLEIDKAAYEYIYSTKISAETKRICINKLDEKLRTLFDFSLMEAFEVFMNEEML